MSSTNPTTYFAASTELADLGPSRFDESTAAIVDRDYALIHPPSSSSYLPAAIQTGRAPRGLENQVFAWNTFQYTTEERDNREELKGDLHEGQLHRQNRAARAMFEGGMLPGGEFGGRGGRGGDEGRGGGGRADALKAGMKPEKDAPPLAKGFAEELDKSLFWEEKIV